MRVAHIAWFKRSEGHSGGVPLFGHYLAQCLEAREYSWRDYPAWQSCDGLAEWDKAEHLNGFLQDTGELVGYDAIVCDGYWAQSLSTNLPVTVVAHGTWAAIGRACKDARALEHSLRQEPIYRQFPTVAVSWAVYRQLKQFHNVEAADVIPNGVDTEVFWPRPKLGRDRPLVLHAASGYPKGSDLCDEIAYWLGPVAKVKYLGAELGEEAEKIAQADVFLAPSRSEGNSYACLQAMACNIPVVSARVGLFEDMADSIVGEVVDTWEPRDYARAIEKVLANYQQYAPRAWVMAHASLEQWTAAWRSYLCRLRARREDAIVGAA